MRLSTLMLVYCGFAFSMVHAEPDVTDAPVLSQEPADRWTPAETLKGQMVTTVAPSPDGKRVAYVQVAALMTDEISALAGQIYVASSDSSERRRFTFGMYSASNPRWSPDGEWLGYIATTADGKANLRIMRSDGGEPRQLTSTKTSVGDFRWAPDSGSIAYVMVDEPTEQEEAKKKAKDDPILVDEDYDYQHLWLVKVPADHGQPEPRRLTEGSFHVNHPFVPGFSWSPDGKVIAFAYTDTPELDDWGSVGVSLVEVESGDVRLFKEGASTPIYSPDGKHVALRVSEGKPTWTFNSRLAVIAADGSGFRLLAKTPDFNPSPIGWINNKTLFAGETNGTLTTSFKIGINGKDVQRFGGEDVVSSSARINHSRTMFGFSSMNSSSPQEAYVSGLKRFRPKQVSAANSHLPDFPLGRTELIRWNAEDGLEIEGLLTYPVGYEVGSRYPLLLIIHGGPAGVFVQSYINYPNGAYPIAVFAAEGYAVLRVNPRGSGGYGQAFRDANRNDWGGKDFGDIMAGVDHVIELGVADPSRMGVMGWSYGGFMTSWVITHTDRFRAASIGAPVTDLISMTGTTDILGFLPDYFDGEFWEREGTYRDHSPLSYVANAKTPALIQHGQADARVPLGQGMAFYRALKRRGIETKMVIYPRKPHWGIEPRQYLHIMRGNVEWFKEHVPTNN